MILDPHKRGDTWYGWEIEVNELDSENVSTPADLTGVSVLIQFRLRNPSGEVGLALVTSDCTIVGNTLTVNKRAPSDFFLKVGVWYWDIQITWTNNDVDTIAEGTLEVVQDVSK